MNTPELHANTIQRFNGLMQCPETKRHLIAYGWVEGMPAVFAHSAELVEDVMGFVSVHGRAVILVLTGTPSEELQLWHITVPSPIFAKVAPVPVGTTLSELCVRHSENRLTTFRVAFWAHSAGIHQIPLYVSSDNSGSEHPLTPRNR